MLIKRRIGRDSPHHVPADPLHFWDSQYGAPREIDNKQSFLIRTSLCQ